MTRQHSLCRLLLTFGLIALVAASSPANAGWLDRLARGAMDAGEAGGVSASRTAGKLTRLGAPAFEDAAHFVSKLPRAENAASLAVHMTPEGHWKFATREGELFTASTPEELARMPGGPPLRQRSQATRTLPL